MDTQVLTSVDTAPIERLQRRGLIAAVAGLILGAMGVVLQPAQFGPSWLIGFTFCTGLSLGSLALLMMQHLSGGQWGLVGRRVFEAGSRLLPYCALLFIPVAVMLPSIYSWARPEVVRTDEIVQFKHRYLNPWFFILRAVIYFTAWWVCAYLLNAWSAAQDRGDVAVTEADTRRFRVVSAPGLIAYVILMSLAAVDWLMSLDPHWYSTIFGFIMVAGQVLCALSFAVAVLALLVEREPMNSVLRAGHFHDLGKLMLAFVMLWAYFSFSQFLIIWAGNLPEEIPFYLQRLAHGWQYVSVVIVAGHFVLPFCLLLSADLKRRPRLLARVAWFIVGIRLVDIIWLIAPVFNQGGMPISLANVGIPVGLAGVWLYLFAGQLGNRALVPVNDPYFKNMLAHAGHGGALGAARTLTGRAAQPGHGARDERRQHPRDHLVRRRPHRDCDRDQPGDVRDVHRARPDRSEERSVRLAARAPGGQDAGRVPRAAIADDAMDRVEGSARQGVQLLAHLRLGGRKGRRRAHPDRQGEGAAAPARDARESGAGRSRRRHARRGDGRIERRTKPAGGAAGSLERPRRCAAGGARRCARRARHPCTAGRARIAKEAGRRAVIRLWALGFSLWEGNGARKAGLQLKPALAAFAVVMATSAPASAQYSSPPQRSTAASAKPAILRDVGIDQKIGQQLPLDLTFKDEGGRDVRLGQFFGARPVVMALAYYQCPMLCSQVLNGMMGSLKTLSFQPGKDYDVVIVSIDPRDGFREAADKKATYVARYGRPDTAAGWHFLTGTDTSIKPLADAIGFRYAYDADLKQFAHPAAMYVATPKGRVARYFMGIDFAPRDVRLGIVEASNNVLGSVADKVLLLCYHYDPATGKYGAATINAVRVGFVATVGALLTFVFVSLRRERRQAQIANRI